MIFDQIFGCALFSVERKFPMYVFKIMHVFQAFIPFWPDEKDEPVDYGNFKVRIRKFSATIIISSYVFLEMYFNV